MTQPADLFSYHDAQQARDAGIAKHSAKEIGREWLKRARAAAKAISLEKGSVNANDVREAIGDPPSASHPTIMGAIFRDKNFEFLQYEPNPRKVCHARPIARFVYRARA